MFTQLDDYLNNERLLLQIIALGSSIGGLIANIEWLQLSKHFKNGGLYSSKTREIRLPNIVGKRFASLFSLTRCAF